MKNTAFKSVFKQFKKKFKRLDLKTDDTKLKKSYKELETAYNKLEDYKGVLEKKVQQEIKKRLEHELLMLEKTRFVTMGEMMDAVAHQWVQPITLISMYVDTLKYEIREDKINKDYFIELLESIDKQKDYMDSTLNEFRNFLNPLNEEVTFELNKTVKKSLNLLKEEFDLNGIELSFKKSDELFIKGNGKEIQHVIINILNNAKDAFKLRNISGCRINISVKQKDSTVSLLIDDNAGGIDELMLDKIFHPYVTTKKAFGGSGIGLYMSQLIMQKHNADISVQNHENGARFSLDFHKQ
ncbi:HAMP domain-containing sensor histidine kinase [Sulfurimonas sp. HSL-1716]|uniref:sensor histidine kinase n=1 Tax=Hydrocurvibacter sulfurireducens TaxID=3131937 RepID=UPI0031F9DB9B